MDEHEKRIDLNDESGITRRDMLRRGAIVGGTLLWVAPAIQSMAPKALARVQGPSPGSCSACFCYNGTKGTSAGSCFTDATPGGPQAPLGTGMFSVDGCGNFCKWQDHFVQPGTQGPGEFPGAPGGPFEHFEYCATSNPECTCSNINGVTCPGGTVHSG
jgi:hypothetical protein